MGRFLSVDPTWESADGGRPQTWNRYTYVENDPLRKTDPDGRNPVISGGLRAAAAACARNPQCATRVAEFTISMGRVGVTLSERWDEAGAGSQALEYDDLPADPDELLDDGYVETTHPEAAKKGHRTFENPQTGDTLRFDKGKPGKPGHQGRDHYHRDNPEAKGKGDKYLAVNGKPVRDGSDASHLYPKETLLDRMKELFK